MNVVISQSMYFPWIGLFEQIRLADVFIHYDDVQFTRGFYNRVQVKMSKSANWITVPMSNYHRGQKINEIMIDESSDWRGKHREILRQAYLTSPYLQDMLDVVDNVFESSSKTIAEISRCSILAIAEYFGINKNIIFLDSTCLNIGGNSSQRLLDIVKKVNGEIYITGHGAKNYLDHQIFEKSQIKIKYMDYLKLPYCQLHGNFNPYVTSLDLIANCGKSGLKYICSNTIPWENFLSAER